jgi:hypothetical protein
MAEGRAADEDSNFRSLDFWVCFQKDLYTSYRGTEEARIGQVSS